ncbi:MAG: ATP-binding protein, partial [Nitrospinota bacterium]|nr:ATP-binding protein [Nitrospinota bacterium]
AVPMGESVDLSVEDQGKGVSKQQQESIFNFLQGNGQKGRDGAQNYGIGLAFCKMVAWVHGGSIWVEQGPRGGAQFVVRLPRD